MEMESTEKKKSTRWSKSSKPWYLLFHPPSSTSGSFSLSLSLSMSIYLCVYIILPSNMCLKISSLIDLFCMPILKMALYHEKEYNINMLPEDCSSMICSLTSPQDACRISMVSSSFQSTADSDTVWESFLPSDYSDILSRASVPVKFSSKKELFHVLCKSILLDDGKKIFALEKSKGQKSYMLSARELSIFSGNETDHWCWKSIQESRFDEVAELKTISRIEIEAKIRAKTLSPNTRYGAYLIAKITDQAFGLDSIPSETSIVVVGEDRRVLQTSTAYLSPKDERRKQMENLFYGNRTQMMKGRVANNINNGDNEKYPVKRKDGWMEIEIGEFFTEENDKEIAMNVMEVKGHQFKGGFIVEGIQIRPKN